MANKDFTDLPTTTASQLTDIICAVQSYIPNVSQGTSQQQTLQQVATLMQSQIILSNHGNPNGFVSGTTYQLCWDITNNLLYVCTSSGTAPDAVWVNVSASTPGINPGLMNELAFYAANGSIISPLTTSPDKVLCTNSSGGPSLTDLLPDAVQLQVGSFNNGTNASVNTFWRGDGTWGIGDGSGSVTSGTINDLTFYAATGTTVSPLSTVNSAGLLTNGLGVPGWVAYTGTGAPVLATSPTLITPNIGIATASRLTFSPTTSGILGVTDASNASTGIVGQFISSVIPFASAISFTSASPKNLTSISLTAGDWDIWGNIFFSGTTTPQTIIGISTTSATFGDKSTQANVAGDAGNGSIGVSAPYQRYNISSTTTVYIVGVVTGTGSLTGCGGIYARRVR